MLALRRLMMGSYISACDGVQGPLAPTGEHSFGVDMPQKDVDNRRVMLIEAAEL